MDDNYNSFFYANACHVCKRFGYSVHLKRCGGCRMIAYCDQKHQKQHWPRHKHLCKIIQDVLKNSKMQTHNMSLQEWAQLKMNLMLLVAVKLTRHLDEYEKQMFRFPRACLICHEQSNQLLKDCQNCASVSFCEKHKNNFDRRHTTYTCNSFKLCFNLDKILSTSINDNFPNLSYLQHILNDKTFQNIKDFINAHMNIVQDLGIPLNIWVAVQSEYLTRPLTLLHGLQILDYVLKSNRLIVHVIAADFIELETAKGWEILLHLISGVTSVKIIMIGPELPHETIVMKVCNTCVMQRKELSFEIHSVLYENYMHSSLFVKPDLVIGFNTGIQECEEITYPEETWTPSIQMLAKQNYPLILTCYTRIETEKEVTRINAILKNEVKYVYCEKNPFASLRPYRDYETENLFYQNNYVIIYKNLCS
ncbi:hypothetical protein HN011_011913 [Eciton burchellii]|nr:hypothetical protein HN011_011913 [Eciton burchellii]